MLQDQFIRKARLLEVIDGDTLKVEIDQGFNLRMITNIRLAGVDTPEIRGSEKIAGKFVADRVIDFLHLRSPIDQQDILLTIKSEKFIQGKYGRCICKVYCGNDCLNDYLLQNRLAWHIDDRGKLIESRNISNLKLPKNIIAAVVSQNACDS